MVERERGGVAATPAPAQPPSRLAHHDSASTLLNTCCAAASHHQLRLNPLPPPHTSTATTTGAVESGSDIGQNRRREGEKAGHSVGFGMVRGRFLLQIQHIYGFFSLDSRWVFLFLLIVVNFGESLSIIVR